MFWTIAVLLILILPSFVSFFWEIWKKPEDVHTLPHLVVSLRFTANHFIQQALVLLTLPYEAVLNMDAIFRTNWRVLISHRYQLKWQPSNSLLNRDNETFFRSYLSMWFPPLLSLAIFDWMSYQETEGIEITLPFLIGWMLVPAITWKISLPYKGKSIDLSDEQKKFLYKLSRKTWAFFETFVVSGDNWLPPDNYQESPVERIAHRTSPTNIGLSLLANLTAWDFGYIPRKFCWKGLPIPCIPCIAWKDTRGIFITGTIPRRLSRCRQNIFQRLIAEIWQAICSRLNRACWLGRSAGVTQPVVPWIKRYRERIDGKN